MLLNDALDRCQSHTGALKVFLTMKALENAK
jgi:hypothetical protein